MLEEVPIECPYCGEVIDLLVDASGGAQHYIEDCRVCCRPIGIHVTVDDDGDVRVTVASENDA